MISFGLWIAGLFGKQFISDKKAERIGLLAAIPLVILVLGGLAYVGMKLHDKGVIEVYQDRRDAQVSRAETEADRKADEALANRAEKAEAENDRLTNAVAEAKRADPVAATRTVGKVQQSYFDNLPDQRKHR